MAIPFMVIEGYHTLLDSRAGRFVEEPTRDDPGWRAFVDATSIVGVAEVDRGTVTGVTLMVHHPEVRTAGTIILVPGSLELDGIPLSDRSPTEAIGALAKVMRLGIDRVDVLDRSSWGDLLGPTSYVLDSPDPVLDDDGQPLFAVGPVEVGGAEVAPFLGRPAPGAGPISIQPRRVLFWNAIIDAPPTTDGELAADLRAIDGENSQVVPLPMTVLEPVALIDLPATESLIRDVVAYPTGAVPGDRLQVRILDRTGTADLEDIAAAVAAQGMEVIEIGNAPTFDGGETEVIVPVSLATAEGTALAELEDLSVTAGTTTVVIDHQSTDDHVVTLVIGRDFDLANLY